MSPDGWRADSCLVVAVVTWEPWLKSDQGDGTGRGAEDRLVALGKAGGGFMSQDSPHPPPPPMSHCLLQTQGSAAR